MSASARLTAPTASIPHWIGGKVTLGVQARARPMYSIPAPVTQRWPRDMEQRMEFSMPTMK